ncbi:HAD domain-containing protein [Paraburkholderia aspalathi]|uniref:Uncharacterized protein n=1 Tax=Paraburkholderia aspalathi TaxID=1324617 RepID=A0A1I7C805_9BURK|nr:HAD domain-containing protein [Paraburkholderia aspalathi]SFT95571.1 hypothetical protein SAMN05192563_10066 [Paraburkholderia aspalathi]
MVQVMYLGVEGVLFENRPTNVRFQRPQLGTLHLKPLPLLTTISRLIAGQPDLSVVLNSRLIADYGYRSIINMLPEPIARNTIGATIPGNRVHRRDATTSRADLLRADIRRRCPNHLVIVDASSYAIPYEYLPMAVHVNTVHPRATAAFADRILNLLYATAEMNDSETGLSA